MKCQINLSARRFRRFLGEDPDHHDPLLPDCHVQCTRCSVLSPHPHFPERARQVPNMWKADAFKSNRRDQLADVHESGAHFRGQGVELFVHSSIQGLNCPADLKSPWARLLKGVFGSCFDLLVSCFSHYSILAMILEVGANSVGGEITTLFTNGAGLCDVGVHTRMLR